MSGWVSNRERCAVAWRTFACTILVVAQTAAGATLTLRAVAASSGPPEVDAALRDVEPLLKRNLPFTRFRLVGSAAIPLPANNATANVGGEIEARCSGDMERLSLTIQQRGRVVVQTQVGLRRGAPLVFSGLAGRDGTTLVVIVAR
ncbi:MAG: hypothetical protein N2652_07805 [Kiritimatiellae bacterium]|nr:hypothetical protein [Kiritimatiellia bacterium]